jgi:hypothetical protein
MKPMSTIQQFPGIALFFGVCALATSVVLIIESPKILRLLLALLWLITGLLALYAGTFRRVAKQPTGGHS